MGFYYWRTTFCLDSQENAALSDNKVSSLFIRYFDVDRPDSGQDPVPVSPISFGCPNQSESPDSPTGSASSDSTTPPRPTPPSASRDRQSSPSSTQPSSVVPSSIQVTPVVFLRNRVFASIDSTGLDSLATRTLRLIGHIDATRNIHPTALQFDCDWTDKTQLAYFQFLRRVRKLSGLFISCTIRLHQVKYAGRTGIPPVDRGVLMYYNMGNIDTGEDNSIYSAGVAARYIPYLKTYPLEMDIALPVFSWGLLIRDGRVAGLLNKMNFYHFENDPNFTAQKPGRYVANNACFKGSYYFKQGDQVKLEHVDDAGLEGIIKDVNRYSNHRLHNIIFYDLDKSNLELYDKKAFGKILDHFD